jgi:hypothetical protein
MKCAYHPAAESQDFCTTCNRSLCVECAHRIKGRVYCQDCLVRGAEWAATVKDMGMPADSPKRAALCSLIPGMGAVYNNEYLKAITFFAVFAALVVLGDVHGIFGFGAFAFLVFTVFDSYRTAENRVRAQLQGTPVQPAPQREHSVAAWGIFLMLLGTVFLLQNIIPYQFLNRLWPLVFVLLGGYLVYRALKDRTANGSPVVPPLPENKQF